MAEKEYIEREVLLEFLRNTYDIPLESWMARNYWTKVVEIKQKFINCIGKIPAADVVEVVHASWDKDGRCTNCGGHAPYIPISLAYHKSPYCFTCGAKMDGATTQMSVAKTNANEEAVT